LLWDYLLSLFDKHRALYSKPSARAALMQSLPYGLQIANYLTVFDGEVLNGGIRQFFHNQTPWEVEQTILALQAIGATTSANQILQAIGVYEEHTDWKRGSKDRFAGPPWNDSDYGEEPTLNAIDDARCNDESSNRDWGLLADYIRLHPDQFLHGGE
jgi:hypothetical protein